MLILSSEHPHSARWQAFAHSLGLPIHTISAHCEDSSFLPLATSTERALLALSPQALECALYAWCKANPDKRSRALVCIADDAEVSDVQRTWDVTIPPATLIGVDHNLAARETVAWSIAWGAAVPVFEGRGVAKEQGLLQRARNAAHVLQQMRQEMDAHHEWSLRSAARPARESRAGFLHVSPDALPRVLRELGTDDAGWVHASAERWSRWQPVFETNVTQVSLRGQGAVRINDQTQRMRGTDVLYLRIIEDVPVRWIGSF